ncbi:glycosyltransferase family 2 protein [Candidatus Saccharibacteria bacterium]|nr:glycosyltransferase family 2 protein [Candidatus Saccharibacteria bacterium]
MTTSQNKKVSVIVPNFNYKKYIKKRLASIVTQSYPIYELIILDDASTDGADSVIEEEIKNIKEKYPKLKVRFEKNKENSGKAIKQWVKGVKLAKGDYVWIAETDDLSKKNFLKNAMKGFEDKDVVISYTESSAINGYGMMLTPNMRFSRDKERTGHYKRSYTKNGEDEIKEILAIRCSIPNVSAVVFKKSDRLLKIMEKAAGFTQVGDWYIYLELLEKGKIAYCKKPLNIFRVHKGSVTHNSHKNRAHFDEIKSIHRMLQDKYDLNEKTVMYMNDELNRVSMKHGIM